jgi:hypothetical protein
MRSVFRTPFLCVLIACGGRTLSTLDESPRPTVLADAAPEASTKRDAGRDAGRDTGNIAPPEPEDGGLTLTPSLQVLAGPDTIAEFAIPPNTLGFHLQAKFSAPGADNMITDVIAPDGSRVHADGIPALGTQITSGSLTGLTAAVQVPQSITAASDPVMPGMWTVKTSVPANIELQVQATPDGQFHGGLLDLHVYLPRGIIVDVAGNSANAANAWGNQTIRDLFLSFFEVMKSFFGMSRGSIEFLDIPQRFVDANENNLVDAFAETRAARSRHGLHVMLSETSDGWWGIAPGVPGAVSSLGLDASAVGLTLIPEATPEQDARALAHEFGHFIGLEHTTELEGGYVDPFPDTAVCVDISKAAIEACPDFENLMFPTGGADNLNQISAMQQRVAAGSPIYRTFLSGTPRRQLRPPSRLRTSSSYGAIFGHVAIPLSSSERWVLAHSCSLSRGKPDAKTRVDLLNLAARTSLPAGMRRIVERLLRK